MPPPLKVDNIVAFIRQMAPIPACWLFNTSDISNKLTFDLLTLKLVSESRVTWATSVSILVFLGFLLLSDICLSRTSGLTREFGPMYATDRHQTDIHQTSAKSIV